MCKIASATKITDKNRDDVWLFMQLLGKTMSVGNTDGLGYAAIDKNGNIFGEKWLVNDSAFKDLSSAPNINAKNIGSLYNYFGTTVNRDHAQAIILHTRAATCERGIKNVHPFIDEQNHPTAAIIHNGMIYNEEDFTKKYSTCDSEVLVHLYKQNNVVEKLGNLNLFTPKLQGWYTVLGLSKQDDGRLIMDAFTMNGRLGSYYIPDLDIRVWSTDASDVAKVANAFGMRVTEGRQMKADTAMRLDVLTDEVIATEKISTGYVSTSFPTVEAMEGNFDDEQFRRKYFGALWPHMGN